jgi:hypothetical protein
VAANVGSIAICGMVCSFLTLAGVLYPCRARNGQPVISAFQAV